jgi:hypothetical protein
VQVRDETWEFYFRRTNYWSCQGLEEWYDPVFDQVELAKMPRTQGDPEPCQE